MKVKIGIIVTLAALATMMFGCTLAPGQASVNLSCDDFASQNQITKEILEVLGGAEALA